MAAPEPSGELALGDALALALAHNPTLAARSWEERAADAEVAGARLRRNPDLSLDIEEFGATGESRGLRATDFTLSLGQVFALGGKRGARVAEARLGRDLAEWDYEAARIDVVSETATAFIDVLAAQWEAALAEQIVRLADEVVTTVSARVAAARSHEVEATRARVALAAARIERDTARRALVIARHRLAASWGGRSPWFERAVGDLDPLPDVPPLEDLAERLPEGPTLARWATERARREAVLRMEMANAQPDIAVAAGVRRKESTDENVGVIGASVAMPLWNRNQGAIAAARARLAGAESEQRAAATSAYAALALAYQELDAARVEVATVDTDVLPGAEDAFETIRAGYEEGRFGYIEVLDAQRTLFAARTQRVHALARYHRSMIEIEAITGAPIAKARQ